MSLSFSVKIQVAIEYYLFTPEIFLSTRNENEKWFEYSNVERDILRTVIYIRNYISINQNDKFCIGALAHAST